MPESTVELLRRAVEAQAAELDKPVGERRPLDDDERPIRVENGRKVR